MRRWGWCVVCAMVIVCGCRPAEKVDETSVRTEPGDVTAPGDGPTAPATPAPAPPTPAPTPAPPAARKPPPPDLWKEISGERAWAEARRLYDLGPRPVGSAANAQARAILAAVLEAYGWRVEMDAFNAEGSEGKAVAANLIGRFPGDGHRPALDKARPVAVVAHYDTRHFTMLDFAGANESASAPALILELARVLAMDPELAAEVELILFDASEPRGQFSATDGLRGSRHFAARMGSALAGRKVLVLRGVGDASLPLDAPVDVTDDLLGAARAAAIGLDPEPAIERHPVRIWADHLPLQEAGARVLLLGNFSSPVRYTRDDDMRRVTPSALKQNGELVVRLVQRWVSRD